MCARSGLSRRSPCKFDAENANVSTDGSGTRCCPRSCETRGTSILGIAAFCAVDLTDWDDVGLAGVARPRRPRTVITACGVQEKQWTHSRTVPAPHTSIGGVGADVVGVMVGDDVVGDDVVGVMVGDDVVGVMVGDDDGTAVVGDWVGDAVGAAVVGDADVTVGELVGDAVACSHRKDSVQLHGASSHCDARPGSVQYNSARKSEREAPGDTNRRR